MDTEEHELKAEGGRRGAAWGVLIDILGVAAVIGLSAWLFGTAIKSQHARREAQRKGIEQIQQTLVWMEGWLAGLQFQRDVNEGKFATPEEARAAVRKAQENFEARFKAH